MAGFLTKMFGNVERRAAVNPKHPRDPALLSIFGDHSGVTVTPDSAMRVTAVWACVSLLSETLAALPIHVYRRKNQVAAKAKNHPLYDILVHSPYSGMTSFEWREMMVSNVALRGDFYARIKTSNSGRITGLEPVMPGHILPRRNKSGAVVYDWRPDGVGPARVLFDDEVFRLPYKMLDGIHSMSPIETHRRTIGNAMRSGQFIEKFYKNSATPNGAIISPEPMGEKAAKAIRDSWERRHQGPENFGKVAILDGGLDWKQFGMTMADAQYLEMSEFSIGDIARIYLIPPHKIGELSKATFSNIEQQSISFVVDTLLSWVKRIEGRANAYLLTPADRLAGYYVGLDLKGLLRGDSAARANLYRTLFYVAAMTPNEIRAAEDLNPYEGGDGYFVQGATVPVGQVGADQPGIDATIATMIDNVLTEKLAETERVKNGKA
jgi:HK97 family phage portal protein